MTAQEARNLTHQSKQNWNNIDYLIRKAAESRARYIELEGDLSFKISVTEHYQNQGFHVDSVERYFDGQYNCKIIVSW